MVDREVRPMLLRGAVLAVVPIVLVACGIVPTNAPPVGSSTAVPSNPATSAEPTRTPTPTRDAPTASTSAPPPSRSASLAPSPAGASCTDAARSLSPAEQAGQLVMVGIDATGGLTASEASAIEESRAGSVILLQNTTAGAAAIKALTEKVRDAAEDPDGVKTLLAADQEGGQVQRLRGSGFDRIPSAEQQAGLTDDRLQGDAKTWGEQLRAAGIDADLAPVADVVPGDLRDVNQPIGVLRRGYGPDARTVADKVGAFTRGMDAAGVATSVKHFPGLGRVRGNTDFTANVVDSTTVRGDRDLAGFRQAVDDDVDMVMMSLAVYSKIDEDHPAVFSTKIIQRMVRGDLGFTGVVISDDLAAKALATLSPGQRALRFLRAGGDLMIVGDPSQAVTMTSAVVAEAKSDPEFAASLATHASRVLAMKAKRGLADCG